MILEFEDPYSGGTLNLRPVIKSGNPSNDIQDDPNRDDPGGVSDPNDPRPTPSRKEVGRIIDGPHLNPNKIEAQVMGCFEDFKLNWHWYLGYASWYAALAAPAIISAMGAIKAAGRGIAGTVGAIAEPQKKLKAAHDNIKNNADSLKQKLTSMANDARKGGANQVITNALETMDEKSQKFKAAVETGRFNKIAKFGLFAAKGSIVVSSWIVVASFLTYHGPEWFQKWAREKLNPDPDAEYGLIQKSIAVLFQTLVVSKSMLAHLALKMNNNFYERCVFSNLAITAVIGAIFGSFIFRGKKTLYTIDETQFKNILKSADDLEKLVKAEAASRLKMFLDDFTKEATGILNGFDDIPQTTKKQYLEVFMGEGSEAAFRIIKDNPNAKVINDSLVKKFNEMEDALKSELRAMGNNVTNITKNEARKVSQGQKQLDDIIESLSKAASRRKFDPRITGDMQLAINSSKGKIFDDIRQSFLSSNRVFKDDMLVDISSGIKNLDDLLESGQITTRQAIKGYKNGVDKNLIKFVDDLVGPQGNIALKEKQRVKKFIETLSSLRTKDDQIKKALEAILGPNGKRDIKANFIDKILRTSKLKKANDAKNLQAAQEAIDEAMASILKINTKMDPAQLKVVEGHIKNAQDQFFKVFRQEYLGTAYNTIADRSSILALRVFIAGVTTAAVLNIVKYTLVRPPQLGTLEGFKAENLAKTLAWDGWLPGLANTEAIENSITYWVELVLGNLRNTPENRKKYPNQAAGSVANTILVTFIFKYNGPGFLKPLFEQGYFDNNSDLSEGSINQIIEKFIEYKVGSGRNDDKFLRAIKQEMGYDKSPDKNNILAKSSRSNIETYWKTKYRPIIGAILCINNGMIEILESLKTDDFFWTLPKYDPPDPNQLQTANGKYGYLYRKLFGWNAKRRKLSIESMERFQRSWLDELGRARKHFQTNTNANEGKNIMNNNQLKHIVRQVMKENYGQGYSDYPYNSEIGMSNEEQQDFIQDWKDFELALVRDESRDTAIEIAKILIKDLELFGDVLDLVGKNQSVATEILKKYREKEDQSKES